MREDIERFVRTLGESFGFTPEFPAPARALPDSVLAACISYSGSWEGALVLRPAPGPARGTAARAFDHASPDGVTAEELRDTAGELGNILAGNVKALLPKGTLLSLPAVIEGERRALVFTLPSWGRDPGWLVYHAEDARWSWAFLSGRQENVDLQSLA